MWWVKQWGSKGNQVNITDSSKVVHSVAPVIKWLFIHLVCALKKIHKTAEHLVCGDPSSFVSLCWDCILSQARWSGVIQCLKMHAQQEVCLTNSFKNGKAAGCAGLTLTPESGHSWSECLVWIYRAGMKKRGLQRGIWPLLRQIENWMMSPPESPFLTHLNECDLGLHLFISLFSEVCLFFKCFSLRMEIGDT